MHDGYVLNQSIVRSPVGGHVLDECLIASLKAKEIDLHPWYLYSKSSKAPGGQSSIQDAGNITKSYMSWSREFLAADMKVSHCRMNEQPFVEEDNLNMPMQTYELPDGSQIDVGVERFKIPEILFNPVRHLLMAACAVWVICDFCRAASAHASSAPGPNSHVLKEAMCMTLQHLNVAKMRAGSDQDHSKHAVCHRQRWPPTDRCC